MYCSRPHSLKFEEIISFQYNYIKRKLLLNVRRYNTPIFIICKVTSIENIKEVTRMNLCSGPPKNATYTKDGHGGKSVEHKEEMRQIAIEVVNEYVPQIAAEIYNNAL